MLKVDKLTAVQRFVLELPDGELEVIGTQFSVHVEPEGTRRVEVTEGRVALRLRAAPPISLGAGESWTSEREAARAAAPRSVPAPEPQLTPAPAAAAPSERSPATARQTVLPETKRALEPPSDEQAAGTNHVHFARAMAAFGAGDYGQAERLSQEFERRHPEDARQEDSMFLRAVARARRGDAAGARATARAYLERYPHGLRAPEAERLAESSK
ncbi:MAG: tetratricopeptide repeat protein [Myxococcales bacterium]|nr:MAG: tetratricopeptide repeat protein [Myxococcales bacterium]